MGISDKYDYDYAIEHQKVDPDTYWEFNQIFKLYKPKKTDKVLEIGSNTGEFCYLLKKNFNTTPIGIDLNKKAISLAKMKYPDLNFQIKDLLEVEDVYDAIYMQHVIEHLEDPVEALNKLSDNLEEGGKLIITCPNNWAYLLRFIAWTQNTKFGYDPTHFSEFNPKSIVKTVKKAGYKPKKIFTNPIGIPFIGRVSQNLYFSLPSFGLGGHIFLIAEK